MFDDQIRSQSIRYPGIRDLDIETRNKKKEKSFSIIHKQLAVQSQSQIPHLLARVLSGEPERKFQINQ